MDSKMGIIIGIVIIVIVGAGLFFFTQTATGPVTIFNPPVPPLSSAKLKASFDATTQSAADGTYTYTFSYDNNSTTTNYAPTKLNSKTKVKWARQNKEIIFLENTPLDSAATSDSNGIANPFFSLTQLTKSLTSGSNPYYKIDNQNISCLPSGAEKTIPCTLTTDSPADFFALLPSALSGEVDTSRFNESKPFRVGERTCTLFTAAFTKNTNPLYEKFKSQFNAQSDTTNPQQAGPQYERSIEQKICVDSVLNEVIWINLKINYGNIPGNTSMVEFDAKLENYTSTILSPADSFPYPFMLTGSTCNTDTNTLELSLIPFSSGTKEVTTSFSDILSLFGLTSEPAPPRTGSSSFERLQPATIPITLPTNQNIPHERLSVKVCMDDYCQSTQACPPATYGTAINTAPAVGNGSSNVQSDTCDARLGPFIIAQSQINASSWQLVIVNQTGQAVNGMSFTTTGTSGTNTYTPTAISASNTSMAVGETKTITLNPNTPLGAGTYNFTTTLTYNAGSLNGLVATASCRGTI